MQNIVNLVMGLIVVAMMSACYTRTAPVIHLVGDSTMADKSDPANNPERGLGQLLHTVFEDGVEIHNHAVNGRSTKSFIDEGKWQVVLDSLEPGDYVFIQFGHNDSKVGDPTRYTNPYTGYRRNLIRYVDETRNAGGIPILLTPVVRRKFNVGGALVDTHGAYPHVMREVAREMHVPLIDMQLRSEDLVAQMGPEESRKLYLWLDPGEYAMFPEGKQDDTHFCEYGAREMVKLVAAGLHEQNHPLADWMQ